jgi:hypothetical protein
MGAWGGQLYPVDFNLGVMVFTRDIRPLGPLDLRVHSYGSALHDSKD